MPAFIQNGGCLSNFILSFYFIINAIFGGSEVSETVHGRKTSDTAGACMKTNTPYQKRV